ncbi:MAG: FtsX-like permease family protein, partial [Candidatus Peregrinibacteria bacterium]
IEAHYKDKIRQTDISQKVGVSVLGIEPEAEDAVTGLKNYVVAGEYLSPNDQGKVMVGSMLLEEYIGNLGPNFPLLKDVPLDSYVRIGFSNGQTKEFRVKGIVETKVDEVSRRVYMNARELRQWISREDLNVNEIAIKLKKGASPDKVANLIRADGRDQLAVIQTFQESLGPFYTDIENTFDMLGAIIGSVSLVVAVITVFIVIFINAITRRKFIGIMKGIGISGTAIELSYVMQSVFYALLGSAIATALIYGFFEPYVAAHPINFPFSDGILAVPFDATVFRFVLLFVSTVVAGYVPAKMIVRRNTLDAILGR